MGKHKTMELMDSIFVPNVDYRKNAYLNWRMNGRTLSERFREFASSYFAIAEKEIEDLLSDNKTKQADIFIFPILFDVVHGIELSLKSLNYELRRITEGKNGNVSYGGHQIKQISQDTKRLLTLLGEKIGKGKVKKPIDGVRTIQAFIDDIYQNTDYMPFARYPVDNNGKDMFYIKSCENVAVDLEVLLKQMSIISATFERLSGFVENCMN